MSKTDLTEEQLERIERYLSQEMDSAQRAAFEKEMQHDSELNRQIEEIRMLQIAIAESGLERELENFHSETPLQREETKAPRGKINLFKWISLAAACCLIAFVAIWSLPENKKSERLYSLYYSPDPGLMTAMTSDDHRYEFEKGMVNYKSGQYDKAIHDWTELLKSDPQNDTLLYFLGAASQAADKQDDAVKYLEEVTKHPQSVFLKEAYWYLGLALLKKGDNQEAVRFIGLSGRPEGYELISNIRDR